MSHLTAGTLPIEMVEASGAHQQFIGVLLQVGKQRPVVSSHPVFTASCSPLIFLCIIISSYLAVFLISRSLSPGGRLRFLLTLSGSVASLLLPAPPPFAAPPLELSVMACTDCDVPATAGPTMWLLFLLALPDFVVLPGSMDGAPPQPPVVPLPLHWPRGDCFPPPSYTRARAPAGQYPLA
jgi:hypothetical protein